MTHPTDEELDVTEVVLRDGWAVGNPITKIDMDLLASAADTITALRTQLAEVRAALDNANKIMDDWTTLHRVIADIRDASGIGSRLMLSELAHEVGKRIAEANARADLAEAALNEAKEETKDANSVLEAWFDRRELGHKAVDQAVLDAASGYLRTSRSGGMSQKKSDLVLAVFQDMARLGAFADLFARAAKTQNEAALAAQIEVDAGLIDALYRMALKDSDADLQSPWKSHKASAYGIALQAIRNQPHDRTALDRMLAEASEKALREAAVMFDDDSNISQTILALIKPEGK